jgi:hypothetical protein
VGLPFPYWLKTAYSTSGRGVRLVSDERSRAVAVQELFEEGGGSVMAQEPAGGQYGQVQGVFDQGRLVAVHTSVQVGTGIGPSAAARLSVDHPQPRRDIAMLGEALTWHGGLTVDYPHQQGAPQYSECNPRTVEPPTRPRAESTSQARSETVVTRCASPSHRNAGMRCATVGLSATRSLRTRKGGSEPRAEQGDRIDDEPATPGACESGRASERASSVLTTAGHRRRAVAARDVWRARDD